MIVTAMPPATSYPAVAPISNFNQSTMQTGSSMLPSATQSSYYVKPYKTNQSIFEVFSK